MKKIVLLRHGESAWNKENRFTGWTDVDLTEKGIADSLPKVNVDLEYTIDNTYKDGEYIKNKVFNQYQPDGYVTDAWCTNLNPQDDIWSKDISVQSDLLTLTYKDDSKLDYYGSNVKEKEKNTRVGNKDNGR